MSDRCFVDTNVLVYLFDRDEPTKQAVARGLLERVTSGMDLVISTQVLQEFYVTVTRKLRLPLAPQEAYEAVARFSSFSTVHIDPTLVLDAIRMSQQHQVSLWDALVIESALTAGCDRLLTEDLHHGWEIRSLQVENPFRDLDNRKPESADGSR